MSFPKRCLLWLPYFLIRCLQGFCNISNENQKMWAFLVIFQSLDFNFCAIFLLWQKFVNAWVIFRKTSFFPFFFFFLQTYPWDNNVPWSTFCTETSSIFLSQLTECWTKLRGTRSCCPTETPNLQMKPNSWNSHWATGELRLHNHDLIVCYYLFYACKIWTNIQRSYLFNISATECRGGQKKAFRKGLGKLMVDKFTGGYQTWESGCNVWVT